MRNFWLIMAGFAALLVLICWAQRTEDQRLLAQCMKDRKEYECVAMLRRPSSDVIPVPIIIQGGR